MARSTSSATGTRAHAHMPFRGGRGAGVDQPSAPVPAPGGAGGGGGGTLGSDVFTFVICLVVVGGAIVGVLALVPRGDGHQPATGRARFRRRPRAGGAVLRLPRRPAETSVRAATAAPVRAASGAATVVVARPEPA